jgi:uncharacterized repeat protein (TIGR01451 family)
VKYFHDSVTVLSPSGLTVFLDIAESASLSDDKDLEITTNQPFIEEELGIYVLDKKNEANIITAKTTNDLKGVFNGIWKLRGTQFADITIVKMVNNSTPKIIDTIQYTILVRNMGGETAINIIVKDSLPVGLSYIDGFSSSGNWTYSNLAIAGLDSGMVDTLTINAVVNAGRFIINTAEFISSDQVDTVTANNCYKACISVLFFTCEGKALRINAPK